MQIRCMPSPMLNINLSPFRRRGMGWGTEGIKVNNLGDGSVGSVPRIIIVFASKLDEAASVMPVRESRTSPG